MDETTAIVTQQLNSTMAAQLAAASYEPWAKGYARKSVGDLIQVNNGHVIINPNSNQALGTGTLNIFENGAKQAIYGAFDIVLESYMSIEVGMYELAGPKDLPYSNKAKLFANLEGKGWTAFHLMNGKYLPMDLPQDGTAIEIMRLKHEWLDLILRGAYIDIDVQTYAPQMYDYFASLLTMTPNAARTTIDAHVANKRERRIAWAASQAEETPIAPVFVVDGKELIMDEVVPLKKLFVRKGERIFTTGTQSAAELSHLSYLLQNGYTLSRSL